MDPLSAAITKALARAAQDTLPPAARDAYDRLKNRVAETIGDDSVVVDALNALEKEPDAEAYQALLQEAVEAAALQDDDEIVKAVQSLADQLKETPGTPEGGTAVQQTVSGNKNIIAGTGDISISGDVVHGNKITNQLDEKVFKRFGLDQRKGMMVLGVIVAVMVSASAFVLYKALREEIPETMTGDFRIAVAGMAEQGDAGETKPGLYLAQGVFLRLQEVVDELNLGFQVTIWPPDWVGTVGGTSPQERAQGAARIADTIGADVVVYGVVDTREPSWRVTPEFYLAQDAFRGAEEISGPHDMPPVTLAGQGALDRISVTRSYISRLEGFFIIFNGIVYYVAKDYEQALEIFQSAATTQGEQSGGKVLYLLMGNAAGKMTQQASANDRAAAREHLDLAKTYYEEALALDAEYARAYVGMGSVSYLQALDRYSETGLPADADAALLTQAIRFYQQAGQAENKPPLANIPVKVHFGLGICYLMRFRAGEVAYREQAIEAFEAVLAANGEVGERVQELAGEAQGRLALIAELSGQRVEAIAAYEQAASLLGTDPQRQALFQQRADSLKQTPLPISPPPFSVGGVQQTVPDDVLKEITLIFSTPSKPKIIPDWAALREAQACTLPTILGESSRSVVIDDYIHIFSCGWSHDYSVDIAITRPDESVIRNRVKVNPHMDVFSFEFRHVLNLFDPPGTYTFAFKGKSGTAQHTVTVQAPGPTLYVGDDQTVQLFGFQPDERVRLFAYQGIPGAAELAGWQEYGVDAAGRLTVQVAVPDVALWVAMGEDSGEVLPFQSRRRGTRLRTSILKHNPSRRERRNLKAGKNDPRKSILKHNP